MTKNLKLGSQEDLEGDSEAESAELEVLELQELDLKDLVVGSHCYWSCLATYIQNSGYKHIVITFTGVHIE